MTFFIFNNNIKIDLIVYDGGIYVRIRPKILMDAKINKKCIPQFNINNLEWAKTILETMNDLQYPVILGVSEAAIEYMGGYYTVTSLVKGLIGDLNINIPVVLHLDHGKVLNRV